MPKFVRDQIDNSDIDGAKPKKKKEIVPHDHYSVTDIQGAHPKPPLIRKKVHDQIYKDVFYKKKFARD